MLPSAAESPFTEKNRAFSSQPKVSSLRALRPWDIWKQATHHHSLCDMDMHVDCAPGADTAILGDSPEQYRENAAL
jgi:hypothetical protein